MPNDFEFIKRQESKLNLFAPRPGDRQIPSAEYNSRTADFVSRFVDAPIATPNRAGVDSIIDQNHIKKEMGLRSRIKTSLETDDGHDLDTKLDAAEQALALGEPADSVGKVFQNTAYPINDDNVSKVVDAKVLKDENHAELLSALDEKPELTDVHAVFSKPDPSYTKLIGDTVGTFSRENIRELMDFLPEGATKRILQHFTSDSKEGALQPFEDAAVLQSELASRLGEAVSPMLGIEKDASLKDALEFISFLPENEEVNLDIENMVKIVFSKDTLQGRINRLSEFDNQFRARYGEEGYTHLAAFMVKEGAVDAASLALALRNPTLARNLISKSRDNLLTRFTKALGRSAVYGLGGTGVQASMNSYLGIETNVPVEFGARVAGAMLGEGVAKAITTSGRKIFGVGADLVNSGERLFTDSGQRVAAASKEAIIQSISDVAPANVVQRKVADFMQETASTGGVLPTDSLATAVTKATPNSSTKPYRQLAGEALETMRQASKEGSLGHVFDMNESEIQAAALGQTSIKEEIMLYGVGNRLIGETIAKQSEVDNVLNLYFDQGLRTVTRRTGALKGDTSLFNWKSLFSDPRNFVGKVADNLFDQLLNKDVYQKALVKAQEVAFKGLSKPATNKMLSVRTKMEELSHFNPKFVVTPEVLAREGLSAAEQDAYYATGKVLDFSAILAETTMVSNAIKKGMKQLDDGSIVKVIETNFDGTSRVKNLDTGVETVVDTNGVKEVTRIMGYKRNFVPRRADQPDYLIGVLDTNTGEITTPFASRSKIEVNAKLLELEKDLVSKQLVPFYFRNMTDEKSLNFGLSNASLSLMDSLDENALATIRKGLQSSTNPALKSGDLEQLRLAFDNVTYGSLVSQQIAGARGAGLKTVTGETFDYKPASEAITQHLMEASALQLRDFRNDAIHKFQQEFTEVLDPNLHWNQKIPNILGKSDLVQRAQSVQDFIRNNVFNETQYGKSIRLATDAWADNLIKSGEIGRLMIKGIEGTPFLRQLFKQTRDGTAFLRASASALVFAGNVGSFVVQTIPSMAMMTGIKAITNPAHLISGWSDFLGALTIRAGLPPRLATKSMKESLRALEQSGILAKADISDLANAAYGQSSTLFNKAMFFVQKGEQVNRANVWFTIRAEMMDAARRGQLMSLNGDRVLSAKDIDSTEFSQIVSEKAKQIFLDTTQAGRLKALSGVGSILGQFTSPVIKTHTMWFAKGLSTKEKVGASFGLFAAFGINGIPFVASGLALSDKIAQIVAGGDELDDYDLVTSMVDNLGNALLDRVDDLAGFTPENKQMFKDAVTKGGIATLTGGNVDLYHKMAIGLFIQQAVDEIDDPLQRIPMVSILTKAAEGASDLGGMFSDLLKAHNNSDSEEQRVIDLRTFMGQALNTAGNILPGLGKFVDVLNNHPDTRRYLNPALEEQDDSGWVKRSGKRIMTGETPTNTQMLLNVLGITPRPVQENQDIMAGQFDRVDILKKLKQNWIDKYKAAGTATARNQIMTDAIHEANEAERLLLATYEGALSIAVKRSDNKPYKPRALGEDSGALGRNWEYAFRAIDMERIAGNVTTSVGEGGKPIDADTTPPHTKLDKTNKAVDDFVGRF